MSAAVDALARPAGQVRSIRYTATTWQGEVVRMIAAVPRPMRGMSVPQAVDALALATSARVRLRLEEAPRGDGRWIRSAMAASAFVPGGGPWAPEGVPAWFGFIDLGGAVAACAAGLLSVVWSAGVATLSTRWRVQRAGVSGRFLDARSGPDRPALWAGPGSVGRTQAMATRIAAAGLLAGVIAEGGRRWSTCRTRSGSGPFLSASTSW